MSAFIKPVADKLVEILRATDLFRDVGQAWTGNPPNFPCCFVRPERTLFDPDQQQARSQVHHFTVKIGVLGGDPEDVIADSLAMVKAVDEALTASDPAQWPSVRWLWIAGHHYGPLFERAGGGISRFPEIDLLVEVTEL